MAEAPQLKKIKAYGYENHIQVTIEGKKYRMTLGDVIDSVDNLREAYAIHVKLQGYDLKNKLKRR